jgi:hypothetical protein
VPLSPELLLKLTELLCESLTNRLSLDDEPAGLPGRPAQVPETQKVEHLRLALASLLPVFGCLAPKLLVRTFMRDSTQHLFATELSPFKAILREDE